MEMHFVKNIERPNSGKVKKAYQTFFYKNKIDIAFYKLKLFLKKVSHRKRFQSIIQIIYKNNIKYIAFHSQQRDFYRDHWTNKNEK